MAKVKVDGVKGVAAPRESIYDSELLRILVIWLHQGSCTVEPVLLHDVRQEVI